MSDKKIGVLLRFAEMIKSKFGENSEQAGSTEAADAQKQYTLADGSKLLIDKLEAGGSVQSVDATGNPTQAAAGEYALTDGTNIVVDDKGMITSVETPTDENAEQGTPEENAELIKAAVEKFATGSPEDRIANLEAMCKALMQYCFGYEMSKGQMDQVKQEAITAYSQSFTQHQTKTQTQIDSITQKFADVTKTMLELAAGIQELAASADDEPIEESNDGKGKLTRGDKFQRAVDKFKK